MGVSPPPESEPQAVSRVTPRIIMAVWYLLHGVLENNLFNIMKRKEFNHQISSFSLLTFVCIQSLNVSCSKEPDVELPKDELALQGIILEENLLMIDI